MKINNALTVCLALSLTGCAANTIDSKTTLAAAETKSKATQTLTSVTDSLRCMDSLFYAAPPTIPLVMISQGVKNESNSNTLMFNDTREILYSAFSEMTARSNAFSFVDYDTSLTDINDARSAVTQDLDLQGKKHQLKVQPTHIIRVSITQAEENIIDSEKGVGLSLASLGGGFGLPELGVSKSEKATIISVDMNLVDFNSRKIIPGVNTRNSLAVVRSGTRAGATGEKHARPDSQVNTSGDIGGTPINFNETSVTGGAFILGALKLSYKMDKNESIPQAVRKLVELGLLELTGKYMKVPYWQCLQNPEKVDSEKEMKMLFDKMSERQRLEAMQKNLMAHGYLVSASIGSLDAATKNAITRFEVESGITASGKVTFDAYKKLVSRKLDIENIITASTAPSTSETPSFSGPPVAPLLKLNKDSYQLGDNVAVEIHSLTDQYVNCYLKDNQGIVSRVYPNRYAEQPIMGKGKKITLGNSSFKIVIDSEEKETLMCVATKTNIFGQLPPRYRVKDFQQIAVQNLDEIVDAYKAVDPLGVAVRSVDISVLPSSPPVN